MKHHLNDELFIDNKAPVVAKKSKPALANLSSAEVTVSVLSQEEFLENLSKNFLKVLAEGLQFNSSSIFSNNLDNVSENNHKVIIACKQFKLVASNDNLDNVSENNHKVITKDTTTVEQ